MRRHFGKAGLARSVAVLALCGAGYAQDADVSDMPDDVIVVTSGPLGVRSDELVGSNEVVDREHIEEHLAGSLADTIAHEPGVSTTYFGPAASRPVIRGLGADRVRVLVNGVGLIDASTSSPDHAVASEALEAERVEILRGPAAIAYGGGAIGGVVNVIDGRIPEERAEDGLEGRFYGGFTSVDDGGTGAGRVRFNAGEFVFQLEMLTRHGDDYSIPGAAELEGPHEDDDHDEDHDEHEEAVFGIVENSGLQFDAVSGGVSWVGDNGFIGFGVKRTEALYGIPGEHLHHGEEDHDDDHDEDHEEHEGEDAAVRVDLEQIRYDLRGEWRNVSDHIDRVRISMGVGEYEHVELEGDEIGTAFSNEGWEGRGEIRFAPQEVMGGSWEGAGGVQAFSRDFTAAGAEAYVPPSVTDDWGLFLVQRWEGDDWGLEGGLRLETREIEALGQTREFDTQSLSGSVFFRPQRDTFLALTVSSNERAPTDVELFADGPHLATGTFEHGSSTLEEEKGLSTELTLRTEIGGWSIEGAAFHAAYDGFIGSFPTGTEEDGLPVFEYRQVDASLTGFEGRAEGPLGQLGSWALSGEVTAEFVDAELDAGGNLPLIPPLSLGAGLSAETERHELHLDVEWHDDQDRFAAHETKTPGYTLIGAGWTLAPFDNRDVRVILEGRNLTDEDARLHTSALKNSVPLPGRNYRVAFVMDF